MPSARDSIEARFARLQSLRIGILLYPEVEVLDFAGPFEVFSVAARLAGNPLPFHISLVGSTRQAVCARHGFAVLPHAGLADAPQFDLLIVPGGVVDAPLADSAMLDWIRRQDAGSALTASVCTGAFILAAAGLLDGAAVTTHWEDIAALRAAHPALEVREDVAWVDQGRIVTAAGISAGIGMSLHLVGRILGPAMARATARQMQYDWPSA
ncbi:MAG TPA: DJ-1/PfpI family protein [Telluria sp.]|jgi:transcriptional regulator GlxA family with amidase domain